MNNFDLRKYLAEGKLNEENYKTLKDFGPDLVSRLKGLGMDSKLFKGQLSVPNNAKDAIAKNPKLAAIAYTEKNGNERIEIIVNKDKFDALKSIKTFFNSLEGDIESGPKVLSNEIGFLSYRKEKEQTNEGTIKERKTISKNKTTMKKSELKEMIKMALSEDARTDAEQEGYKDGFDDAKDDIEAKLKDMKVSEGDNYYEDSMDEAEEEEVEITDTEEEVEISDTEEEAPSLISSNDEKILNSLEAALSSAQELGDEKLMNQIGNTITFFTRQHIVKEEDLFEMKRMKRLAGILK